MSCSLFKLRFTAPVHIGTSDSALSLQSSEEHFCADTLFSALCHTALHTEGESGLNRLCQIARDGKLLLSAALPTDEELEKVMAEASYQLIRRGGFVQSETYSTEAMRKKTQYFLAADSVVKKRFSGALYDVGSGGAHAVYRYSKPIFLGVAL